MTQKKLKFTKIIQSNYFVLTLIYFVRSTGCSYPTCLLSTCVLVCVCVQFFGFFILFFSFNSPTFRFLSRIQYITSGCINAMQLQKQLLHRPLCIAMWFYRRNALHIFVFHARISLYRASFRRIRKKHTQKPKIWQTNSGIIIAIIRAIARMKENKNE